MTYISTFYTQQRGVERSALESEIFTAEIYEGYNGSRNQGLLQRGMRNVNGSQIAYSLSIVRAVGAIVIQAQLTVQYDCVSKDLKQAR